MTQQDRIFDSAESFCTHPQRICFQENLVQVVIAITTETVKILCAWKP